MKNLIRKIKKAPWVLGQPLTKIPSDSSAKISDLFVWRCDENWQTYFELLDMASILGDSDNHKAYIIFFNEQGEKIHSQTLKLTANNRHTLNIYDILIALKNSKNKTIGNFGSFCIFHNKTPNIVIQSNAFIAERGYISYKYKNAPLRNYVHGNFDAISNENSNDLKLLTGNSFLSRKYNLQYLLLPKVNYDIALVNTSANSKKVIFQIVSTSTKKILTTKQTTINPRATFIFTIKQITASSRLIISSKMIMARPVIFVNNNDKIDVFHG